MHYFPPHVRNGVKILQRQSSIESNLCQTLSELYQQGLKNKKFGVYLLRSRLHEGKRIKRNLWGLNEG